jgi:hypothetical protein
VASANARQHLLHVGAEDSTPNQVISAPINMPRGPRPVRTTVTWTSVPPLGVDRSRYRHWLPGAQVSDSTAVTVTSPDAAFHS